MTKLNKQRLMELAGIKNKKIFNENASKESIEKVVLFFQNQSKDWRTPLSKLPGIIDIVKIINEGIDVWAVKELDVYKNWEIEDFKEVLVKLNLDHLITN